TDDETQIRAWINDGTLTPRPGTDETNLLFLVFAPRATKITGGACGWHKHAKLNANSKNDDLFWAIVRTDQAPTTTERGFVNSVAYCVSHELAESFTNRDGAGYISTKCDDKNTCEIGDICETGGQSGSCCSTFAYPSSDNQSWDIELYWSG